MLGLGVEAVHTDRFARYSARLTRDILSIPGLPDLALSNALRGNVLMRLRPGLMLEVGLAVMLIRSYPPVPPRPTIPVARLILVPSNAFA